MATNPLKIGKAVQLESVPTVSAPAAAAGTIYFDSTSASFKKCEDGSTFTPFAAGAVNSGTAGDLALYPTTSSSVGDTYVQNAHNIKVAIAAQGTRSADITYSFPNPGDAITAASVVLTEGVQTINGAKTFSSDVVMSGNLTVNGTTTSLNTTNTNITDALITLNKGGATASGGGSGFEVEENASITGYVKVSAARTGFDLKAPATAGVATFVTDTTSRTYTLPPATGTLLTKVVQDTSPQLGGGLDVNGQSIKSASNGNIIVAPNGTGRILIAKDGALTRYIDKQYIDSITLTASTTAVASALTYDSTAFKGQLIEYIVSEATSNKRRIGRLMTVCDGATGVAATNATVVDLSSETADVGITWTAAMNSNNVELSYTTTANNKSMQVLSMRLL